MRRSTSLHSIDETIQRNVSNDKYQDVQAVGENITEVVAVGTNIAEVLLANANIGDIQLVNSNLVDLQLLADHIDNTISTDITLLAHNIDGTVSSDIPLLMDHIDGTLSSDIPLVADGLVDINSFLNTYFAGHADDGAVGTYITANGLSLTTGDLYFNTTDNHLMIYDGAQWVHAVTESSTSTLINKTINDISNVVASNIVHMEVEAAGGQSIAIGDVLEATNIVGDDLIKVQKHSSLGNPVIGIALDAMGPSDRGRAMVTGVFTGYDSTGLTLHTILYGDGTGGLTPTPTIADGNYNQPIAFVQKVNGASADLVVNIHSAHESGNLISYDNTTSGLTATNTQDALDEIIAQKAAIDGIATLDGAGLVPTAQLPSYVDDVIEVATYAALPGTGETGKLYIVVADETSGGDTSTYRWTGAAYALVSNTLSATDIKSLYEGNADTNVYTDAEKTSVDIATALTTTATTLPTAINEVDAKVASDVPFTPAGFVESTDVQAAIVENDTRITDVEASAIAFSIALG